ncbi:hypothetical protein [Ekhidna sp.]|uniref:hypothetical protein n=1 Tax=Ekhidna sp. TaxID=2608089 RepID=UPI003510EBBF
MKKHHNILLTLTLIFAVNVGYANTTGVVNKSVNQEQEQEGRRRSDQGMVRPDGDVNNSQTSIVGVQEEPKSEPQAEEPNFKPEEKADSVEDDSVSKYNFIFYFLYKFKYEEAP